MAANNFVELIERLPDHSDPLLTFIRPNQHENETLNRPELCARAMRVAARLQTICVRGDRVLLGFQPGLDFIVGFVPAPMPT